MQGWGPQGQSLTLRMAQGQKIVALAQRVLALALISKTTGPGLYPSHSFVISVLSVMSLYFTSL